MASCGEVRRKRLPHGDEDDTVVMMTLGGTPLDVEGRKHSTVLGVD